MSILFNNDNDPSKGKSPDVGLTPSSVPKESGIIENPAIVQRVDDFAIFPQWDVVPPNAIINPRLKKSI